jgi:hypothetical protein
MLEHKIEDVTTFANQPITFSFWGKVSTGTHTITPEVVQRFGTGGSGAVVTSGTDVTFTTSWVRYSVSISVPAITGKTVGAGSSTSVRLKVGTSGIKTFSTWGWQAEYGSKLTPFQTAGGGSPQEELAMCQRYYYRWTPTATAQLAGIGFADFTTSALVPVVFPVTMRTKPTALEQSGTAADYSLRIAAASTVTCSAVPTFASATEVAGTSSFNVTAGLVAGQALGARSAATTGYLGWSAEL